MLHPNDLLDEISQQFSKLADNKSQVKEDIKQNIHSILNTGLSKLDVVSREEFEIQQQILQRTRQKVELLEQNLAELEKMLHEQKQQD